MTDPQDLDAVFRIGSEEADRIARRHLIVEIVWIALCRVHDVLITEVFEQASLNVATLRDRLSDLAQEKSAVMKPVKGDDVRIAQECFDLFRDARKSAESLGRMHPAPIDLLVELSERATDDVADVLKEAGTTPHELNTHALAIRSQRLKPAPAGQPVPTGSRKQQFEQLTTDYTELARSGGLSPVIGRHDEILQVLQVLARKQKNNPVLVGEPGVGKTAIVEGLALQVISEGGSPHIKGKRILELSMTSLLAGTQYRGDLEERLQSVLQRAETDQDIILFIDELHMLIGAGRAEGAAMDAANILKPALARGRIRLIGATTSAEYHKHIEGDAALERRFQPITVEEPTPAETVEILHGLKTSYEQHHQVQITDAAVDAAVELTVRYVPERRLPDKARDVIDQAAARARIRTLSPGSPDANVPIVIGREHVSATIAAWKGIPSEQVGQSDREQLKSLAERLKQRVIGQDEIVAEVADAVRIAVLGLADPNRPNGVFLFCGPTGVGKTELARALAEQLFGDEAALVRFDMSEYMESHSVSALIGAAPGLVGYEDGGRLTQAVRERPFCVLLLDEIEKAHPKVLNLLLQAFGDGRLTDSRGRTADFRNAVIIMTSNLGAAAGIEAEAGGFGFHIDRPEQDRLREAIDQAIQKEFPPEFIGRISAISIFRPLSEETAHKIIDKGLSRLARQLKSRKVELEVTDDVYDLLLDVGFSRELGARPLEQALDRLIRTVVARALLDVESAGDRNQLEIRREDESVVAEWR